MPQQGFVSFLCKSFLIIQKELYLCSQYTDNETMSSAAYILLGLNILSFYIGGLWVLAGDGVQLLYGALCL